MQLLTNVENSKLNMVTVGRQNFDPEAKPFTSVDLTPVKSSDQQFECEWF